jgi:quercetin dioxygenase-like cupin family protein
MVVIDINKLELNEFTAESKSSQACRAAFPMLGMHGTEKSATVFIELKPGKELGRHTDSEEEILFVLQGEVEVEVGGETAGGGKGNLVLVPQMVPHNIKNVGTETAKILGFFGGANNIVATFENVWMPTGSNMVDTAAMNS